MKRTKAVTNDEFLAAARLPRSKDEQAFIDEQQLETALKERIEDLALALDLFPTVARSPSDLRFGRSRGGDGIRVNTDEGKFCDFSEPNPRNPNKPIGGGPFELIAHILSIPRRDAVEWGRAWWKNNQGVMPRELRLETQAEKREREAERTRKALDYWKKAKFDYGELKHYLKNRIGEWRLTRLGHIEDMRFAPRFLHTGTNKNYPAMLVLLRDAVTNEERAIQATYLVDEVGFGFKNLKIKSEADGKLKSQREYRGSPAGAVFKGFCPDEHVGDTLCVAEGVETAMSIVVAGLRSVWATCGSMAALPVIERVKTLYIFADNDPKEQGLKFARACEKRWRDAGKTVRIIMPNKPGEDFNDVLNRVLKSK